jgi:hypothetical protein
MKSGGSCINMEKLSNKNIRSDKRIYNSLASICGTLTVAGAGLSGLLLDNRKNQIEQAVNNSVQIKIAEDFNISPELLSSLQYDGVIGAVTICSLALAYFTADFLDKSRKTQERYNRN